MSNKNSISKTSWSSRRGWLKNGNRCGDLRKSLRCGARTRSGTSCRGPAMSNGRCRMHGGVSTGPLTLEGLERSRRAKWKHGLYSAEAKAEQRLLRDFLRDTLRLLRNVNRN